MNSPGSPDHARRQDLTIAEVRACPMFAHLSDRETEEVIRTLKEFTLIVHNYCKISRKILDK